MKKRTKAIIMKAEKKTISVSTWLGVAVAVFEVAMYMISRSQAILIDGVYDSIDVVMLVAYQLLLPLLYKPISERIPFGYAQVETLFLLLKGSVLIVVTAVIIYDDIKLLLHGGSDIDTGQVLFFETALTVFCVFGWLLVRHLGHRLGTPMIKVELLTWKIDVFLSLGAMIAFLVAELFLRFGVLKWFVPYIDPLVSCIIAALMMPEPVRAFVNALRELVLIAPPEEKLDMIRDVCSDTLKEYPYDIDFIDAVRTGRRVWISLYFTCEGNLIDVRHIKQATEDLTKGIRKIYPDVYVEMIPEIHPGDSEE